MRKRAYLLAAIIFFSGLLSACEAIEEYVPEEVMAALPVSEEHRFRITEIEVEADAQQSGGFVLRILGYLPEAPDDETRGQARCTFKKAGMDEVEIAKLEVEQVGSGYGLADDEIPFRFPEAGEYEIICHNTSDDSTVMVQVDVFGFASGDCESLGVEDYFDGTFVSEEFEGPGKITCSWLAFKVGDDPCDNLLEIRLEHYGPGKETALANRFGELKQLVEEYLEGHRLGLEFERGNPYIGSRKWDDNCGDLACEIFDEAIAWTKGTRFANLVLWSGCDLDEVPYVDVGMLSIEPVNTFLGERLAEE